MSALKTAALAAAVAGGLLASADAQAYDHWGRGHGGWGHVEPRAYHHAPVYVHPRIARKQAQLQKRFIQKFGYIPDAGHGYHQPRPHWGHPHYRPQVRSYHYGW
jgi:hypothetical protein